MSSCKYDIGDVGWHRRRVFLSGVEWTVHHRRHDNLRERRGCWSSRSRSPLSTVLRTRFSVTRSRCGRASISLAMSTAALLIERRRMSLEEWANLPEDEPGELVDGELVEDEVADCDHEDVVAWVFGALWVWMTMVARGGHTGRVYGSDGKYAVRPGRGRKADVSAFLPGTPLPPRHGPCTTPPDIIVEVISSDPRDVRRDRIEKAADYAAFGVRFYWLIDPDARTFEIFELQRGGHYLCVVGISGGAIDVPGCDGLRLDLDALWAKLDRLA